MAIWPEIRYESAQSVQIYGGDVTKLSALEALASFWEIWEFGKFRGLLQLVGAKRVEQILRVRILLKFKVL